jgi:protein phosphatase
MIDLTRALKMASSTDPGMVRSHNEDSLAIDTDIGLAVLADGMGGYNAGEVASGIAVALIREEVRKALADSDPSRSEASPVLRAVRVLREQCTRANASIFQSAQNQPQYAGMGTTLVVAVFRDNRVLLGHVGDSRCYRLRDGRLQQITRDHSLLQEQIDAGLITPEQAAFSANKNLVTRAVGVEDSVLLETHQHDVLPGDLFLMCSDGLSDMLDDDGISQVLQQHESLEQCTHGLIEAANDAGGKDNISVILGRATGSVALQAGRSWWPFKR